jgi:hypothetical protein
MPPLSSIDHSTGAPSSVADPLDSLPGNFAEGAELKGQRHPRRDRDAAVLNADSNIGTVDADMNTGLKLTVAARC